MEREILLLKEAFEQFKKEIDAQLTALVKSILDIKNDLERLERKIRIHRTRE